MKDVAEKKLSLSQTLCFFRSVIQSGEPWSATCQEAFDNAVAELRHFAAREREEWIPVSERLPGQYASALITHSDTRDGSPTVEEAQWNGDKWCLVRSNPQDEAIFLDEQVLAWRELPVPFTAAQGEGK